MTTEETPTESSDAALGDPPADEIAAEVMELRAQIATLQEQSEERLAAWQRAQADYQNLKKRSENEVEERVFRSTTSLLLALLPVVDDFDRAVENDSEEDASPWVDGIRLIHRKLHQFLEQLGVQPIATEGQPFDPAFHEALGQGPGPAGQILTQIQNGYVIGSRVLRPAQVIVGNEEIEPADDQTEASGAAETESPQSNAASTDQD